MLGCIYTSRFRTLARDVGLGTLLTFPERVEQARRKREFERSPVSQVRVHLGPVAVDAAVSSAGEYASILSAQNDKHLISALGYFTDAEMPVFWDVGANIGLYTIALAKMLRKRGGKVVAFEPEPRAVQRLRENLVLNQIDNVIFQTTALGAEHGIAKLSVSEAAHSGTHSLVTRPNAFSECIEVNVAPGDSLVQAGSVPAPTIAKVDVEGLEADVIKGMIKQISNPRFEALLCEVHFSILAAAGQRDAPEWIIGTLRACGLEYIYWLDPSHLLAARRNRSQWKSR